MRPCVLLLKSGSRAKPIQCMGKENAGTNQAQNRGDCFIHGKCPFRPGSDKTTTMLHSQKESSPKIENRT
jgi:hypothetical protein